MEIQNANTSTVNNAAIEASSENCCKKKGPKKGFGRSRSERRESKNLSETIESKVQSEFGNGQELSGKITKFIKKEIKAIFAKEREEQHCVMTPETSPETAPEISAGEPGTKSYKEVIGDFIEPGSDGKIGEKELQHGLAQFSLYQSGSKALQVYQDAYESSGSVSDALGAVRDSGLMTAEDADWVHSYTRFASEFDREHVGGDLRISVSLSDSERYDFDDAIQWAEANLAHVIGGKYEVETVPVAVTDSYVDYQFQTTQSEAIQFDTSLQINEEDEDREEEIS